MRTMNKLDATLAIICSLCLFGMVLTPCVSAQLAIDEHAAKKINASAYVSIDNLSYSGSDGVVDLDGTFCVYNWDQKRGISYNGEIRLEIFDLDGNTYRPDSKKQVAGSLKKNDEDAHWWEVYDRITKNTNLHVECLKSAGTAEPITADTWYEMSANIALRVTGFHVNETWETSYSSDFQHKPEADVEQLEGLGPTKDGETFSDDCIVNTNNERENWQSLIYTDGVYDVVYWYVKAPGDSSYYGSPVDTSWGDGATRKATMTTSFPDDVEDPDKEGTEKRVYYEIIAHVYRSDKSIYTKSYLVDVYDKKQ